MAYVNKMLTSEEYKAVVKDVLEYFHAFCHNHGLKYFIAYGSLLGTIRHQGFIPWDDDVDVYMMREDYDRFISIISQLDNGFYVLSSTTSKYYYNNFTRFCSDSCILKLRGIENIDNLGAFIDIFPLDNVPLDKNERMLFFKDIKTAKEDIMYSLPLQYFFTCSFKRIIKYCFNVPRRVKCRYIVGTKKLKEKRDLLLRKYQDRDVGLYADLFDSPSDSLLVQKSEIEECMEYQFEDIKVNVPNGFNTLLKRIYGDYMVLPRLDERVTHHHFTPFWKDDTKDKAKVQ